MHQLVRMGHSLSPATFMLALLPLALSRACLPCQELIATHDARAQPSPLAAARIRSSSSHTNPVQNSTELQLIVLWRPEGTETASIYEQALRAFDVIDVRIMPAFANPEQRVRLMNQFYARQRRGTLVDDERGTVAFVLLFVRIPTSHRDEPCTGGEPGHRRGRCAVLNNFKTSVRYMIRNRHGPTGHMIHATNSAEECAENLAALGIEREQERGRSRCCSNECWHWQWIFPCVQEVSKRSSAYSTLTSDRQHDRPHMTDGKKILT